MRRCANLPTGTAQLSDGRIALIIFTNSTLGTLPELWGQLKNGVINLVVHGVGAAFMVELEL